MKKRFWLKILAAMIITMTVCALWLVAFSCIPRELLKDNAEKSADYFCSHDAFPVLFDDYINSIQDNYADTYTLAVAYGIDEKHPFLSAMKAMYTQGKYETIADAFKAQVYDERTLDKEYGRYWHGMVPYVRFMMIFTDICYMRIIAGIATIFLFILDMILLYKKREKAVAVCLGIALMGIHPWMLFYSLEYVPTFFVTAFALLFILLNKKAVSYKDMMIFFTVVGVITCFADFLTTETLTFTIPMLVLLILAERTDAFSSLKERIIYIFAGGISWVLGYVGMFAGKFVLLYAVCGREVFEGAIEEALFRMGGDVYLGDSNLYPVATTWEKYKGAIWHNLAALFPIKTSAMTEFRATFPVIVIILLCFSLIYLFHAKINVNRMVAMMILAIIPYVRFLALSNHSYLHYFFAYRAQMITLLVLLMVTWENAFLPLFSRLKGVR
ncbi:hypothetical protein [Butyrivibrio sp. MB2005]|uniref:hypothetical protein n=1 Tax=Butyrivibrio sp. MB2005 TaxID=1280678 RepID=UPI00040D0047|nr:hypothetical protein [Butyrivibrio sp. MB2005]